MLPGRWVKMPLGISLAASRAGARGSRGGAALQERRAVPRHEIRAPQRGVRDREGQTQMAFVIFRAVQKRFGHLPVLCAGARQKSQREIGVAVEDRVDGRVMRGKRQERSSIGIMASGGRSHHPFAAGTGQRNHPFDPGAASNQLGDNAGVGKPDAAQPRLHQVISQRQDFTGQGAQVAAGQTRSAAGPGKPRWHCLTDPTGRCRGC